MNNLGNTRRRRSSGLHLVFFASITLIVVSCHIPVLESAQCMEARRDLKRFYSFHFANDMAPTSENLATRRVYLTEELYEELTKTGVTIDYFTQSPDYPRTFKIGKCDHFPDAGNLTMQVQLYWRDDETAVQREVNVDVYQRDNIHGLPAWLLGKVY